MVLADHLGFPAVPTEQGQRRDRVPQVLTAQPRGARYR